MLLKYSPDSCANLFAFIVFGFVLIAGCTTQPTPTTGMITPTISTTSPQQALVTSQTIMVAPAETVDTLCGELVYCGYAPSGFKTQPIKSTASAGSEC